MERPPSKYREINLSVACVGDGARRAWMLSREWRRHRALRVWGGGAPESAPEEDTRASQRAELAHFMMEDPRTIRRGTGCHLGGAGVERIGDHPSTSRYVVYMVTCKDKSSIPHLRTSSASCARAAPPGGRGAVRKGAPAARASQSARSISAGFAACASAARVFPVPQFYLGLDPCPRGILPAHRHGASGSGVFSPRRFTGSARPRRPSARRC